MQWKCCIYYASFYSLGLVIHKKLYLTSPGASHVIYDLNVLLVLPGFCLKVFVTRFVILLACSHGFY